MSEVFQPSLLEQLIDMESYVRELRIKEQSQIYQKNIIKFNPNRRDQLVCWIIEHCDSQGDISQKTKEVTVQLIDLYLNFFQLPAKYYQLLAMSALQISIKAHENWSYRIVDLVQLSGQLYTENDFEFIELQIMRLMKWNCIRISPSDYTDLIWEIYLKYIFEHHNKAYIEKIVDVTISSFELHNFEPGIIAVGSIIYNIRFVIKNPQLEIDFRNIIENSNNVFQFDMNQIDLYLMTIEAIIQPNGIQHQNQAEGQNDQNPQDMIIQQDHSIDHDEVDLSTNQTLDNQNNENSVASSNANLENENLLQFENSSNNSVNNDSNGNGQFIPLSVGQLQYQQQQSPSMPEISQMQQEQQIPGTPELRASLPDFQRNEDFLEGLNKEGVKQSYVYKSQNEESLMQSQETNTSQSLMHSASKQFQLEEICPSQDVSFSYDP